MAKSKLITSLPPSAQFNFFMMASGDHGGVARCGFLPESTWHATTCRRHQLAVSAAKSNLLGHFFTCVQGVEMQPCSVVGCDCPALDDASGCCASHLPNDQHFELGDIAFVTVTDDATLVPLDGVLQVPSTIVFVAPTQF